MEKLTHKEEEIMCILWKLEKAFVKEIQAEMSDGVLHYNTVSTMVRNLEEKSYVSYKAFGKTHQYFPLVTRENYRKGVISLTTQRYFDNSYKSLVSFFAKEEKISASELREILDLIEKEK